MRRWIAGAGLGLATLMIGAQTDPAKRFDTNPYPGQLTMLDAKGRAGALCPLERTSVNAHIGGFGAEVSVVQTFVNPTRETIEAVYTFPLPSDAAVHRMRMKIGDRVIEGQIRRREEARRVYEQAKAAGQSAALLDQERPNIFTQSVANITPGAKIQVEISYVQVMKYDAGQFEFSFPMTVGPRYMGHTPDPAKIDPPRATRVGTNIDLTVDIDAGTGISNVQSILHEIDTVGLGGNRVRVSLKKQDELPNRDFVLRYQAVGQQPKMAFLTHSDKRGGFFTLLVMPPARPVADQIMPREVIFVMDQSGSQEGFPLEKSKEVTRKMIDRLRPGDTFNVLGFNNAVRKLWEEPRPYTPENATQAKAYVDAMDARGGTEIGLGAIAALSGQYDPARLRLVVYNTDGLVGDDKGVLGAIQAHRGHARMFTFGIGNGVNRSLIDAMAEEGRGYSDYVTLAEQADKAVANFVKRTQTPVLTDLTANFTGVTVFDIEPKLLPDAFDTQPVTIYGRYSGSGHGRVTLNGKMGGKPWSQTLELDFGSAPGAPAVPVLWARKRVAEIERSAYQAGLGGKAPSAESVAEKVTDLALKFSLMSAYTSFVAVESRVVNIGGKQRTVAVPVEQTDGVLPFGGVDEKLGIYTRGTMRSGTALNRAANSAASYGGLGGGGFGGGGAGGGQGGGTAGYPAGGGKAAGLPPQSAGIPPNVNYITYDPKDNSIVLDAKGESALKKGDKETPAQWRQRAFAVKVHPKLKAAKGRVEVRIWVVKVDSALLEALKKAGFTLADSDKGLKMVFGATDAAQLKSVAEIEGVLRIEPL